jgi:hypothetical protein
MDYAFVISRPMLSFPMFVPRQPQGSRSTIASRSQLKFFICYYCKLFCLPKEVISFIISSFHTLCAKHPGWGIPNESSITHYFAATSHSPLSSISFRINTYRTVSNKIALSPFGMNTCEKPWGEGVPLTAPAQAAQ